MLVLGTPKLAIYMYIVETRGLDYKKWARLINRACQSVCMLQWYIMVHQRPGKYSAYDKSMSISNIY